MNILKQRLENILIELELGIKQLTERQNSEVESLSSNNNVVVEHLKDLQHILTIATKIIHHLLTDKLDQKTEG